MTLVDYFSGGALINILRTNSGPTSPDVWVTSQPDGSYRYGFEKMTNSIGGHSAPFGTVEGGKIFASERKKVEEFLKTFGLSEADAETVISRIGIDPPLKNIEELGRDQGN